MSRALRAHWSRTEHLAVGCALAHRVAMSEAEVELCGRLADLVGRRVVLPLPADGLRLADFLALVAERIPPLACDIAAGRVRVCVDETMATAGDLVRPAQRIALFPPVSGG